MTGTPVAGYLGEGNCISATFRSCKYQAINSVRDFEVKIGSYSTHEMSTSSCDILVK